MRLAGDLSFHLRDYEAASTPLDLRAVDGDWHHVVAFFTAADWCK